MRERITARAGSNWTSILDTLRTGRTAARRCPDPRCLGKTRPHPPRRVARRLPKPVAKCVAVRRTILAVVPPSLLSRCNVYESFATMAADGCSIQANSLFFAISGWRGTGSSHVRLRNVSSRIQTNVRPRPRFAILQTEAQYDTPYSSSALRTETKICSETVITREVVEFRQPLSLSHEPFAKTQNHLNAPLHFLCGTIHQLALN